jgi:transketolase
MCIIAFRAAGSGRFCLQEEGGMFSIMAEPLCQQDLVRKANDLRLMALDMIYCAQSGHLAPAFSIAEIIAALYYRVLRINPQDPLWQRRDRFVLSKGHACAILYAALAERGFFPLSDLQHFREISSHLQGHPKLGTPGIDASTGALGIGASIATGMAFAGKMQDFSVYALLSDGEMNVGLVWEAALFAAHHHLSNLTFIVDRNMLQYTGATEEVLTIEPLPEKWLAFGWEVQVIDGHNVSELLDALCTRRGALPHMIIAHTIKGKGVSFMEHALKWHGTSPDPAEYQAARAELLARR